MVFFVVDIISRYQVIHWLPILLLSDHVTKLFITISLQFIENSISPGHNLVFHRNPLHRYSQTNFLNFKTAAALLYFHFKHKKPRSKHGMCLQTTRNPDFHQLFLHNPIYFNNPAALIQLPNDFLDDCEQYQIHTKRVCPCDNALKRYRSILST